MTGSRFHPRGIVIHVKSVNRNVLKLANIFLAGNLFHERDSGENYRGKLPVLFVFLASRFRLLLV